MILYKKLKVMGACPSALAWVEVEEYADFASAKKACPRPDWLLWLVEKRYGRIGWPTKREIFTSLCACVEMAIKTIEDPSPDLLENLTRIRNSVRLQNTESDLRLEERLLQEALRRLERVRANNYDEITTRGVYIVEILQRVVDAKKLADVLRETLPMPDTL